MAPHANSSTRNSLPTWAAPWSTWVGLQVPLPRDGAPAVGASSPRTGWARLMHGWFHR